MRLKYWYIKLYLQMIYYMTYPQDNYIAILPKFSLIVWQTQQTFLNIIWPTSAPYQFYLKKEKKMFLKVQWWSVIEDEFGLCIHWTPNWGPQEIVYFLNSFLETNYNSFYSHCRILFMSCPQPNRLWKIRKWVYSLHWRSGIPAFSTLFLTLTSSGFIYSGPLNCTIFSYLF